MRLAARVLCAALALLVLGAGPAAARLYETPASVGLPADQVQLSVECAARIMILKDWADAGRSTGFETSAIDAAGRGWIPAAIHGLVGQGQSTQAAEGKVLDRSDAIEAEMRSGGAEKSLFGMRTIFCVRHPPAV